MTTAPTNPFLIPASSSPPPMWWLSSTWKGELGLKDVCHANNHPKPSTPTTWSGASPPSRGSVGLYVVHGSWNNLKPGEGMWRLLEDLLHPQSRLDVEYATGIIQVDSSGTNLNANHIALLDRIDGIATRGIDLYSSVEVEDLRTNCSSGKVGDLPIVVLKIKVQGQFELSKVDQHAYIGTGVGFVFFLAPESDPNTKGGSGAVLCWIRGKNLNITRNLWSPVKVPGSRSISCNGDGAIVNTQHS